MSGSPLSTGQHGLVLLVLTVSLFVTVWPEVRADGVKEETQPSADDPTGLLSLNLNIVRTLKDLSRGIQDDLILRLDSALNNSATDTEPGDLADLKENLFTLTRLSGLFPPESGKSSTSNDTLTFLRVILAGISKIVKSQSGPTALDILLQNLGKQEKSLKFLIDASNGTRVDDLTPSEWLEPLKNTARELMNHINLVIRPLTQDAFSFAMRNISDLASKALLVKYNPAHEEFSSAPTIDVAQRLAADLNHAEEFMAQLKANLNSNVSDSEFVQEFLTEFQSSVVPIPHNVALTRLAVTVRMIEIVESAWLPNHGPPMSMSSSATPKLKLECTSLLQLVVTFLTKETTWATFLVNLSEELSGADVQVTDSLGLRKWAQASSSVQLTTRDSFSDFLRRFDRLKTISDVGGSTVEKVIDSYEAEKLGTLSKLLDTYLQNSTTYVYDDREGIGYVDGHFVVMSDVVRRIGQRWPKNVLAISASSTIFLDVNLEPPARDPPMSVAIVAPIWWTSPDSNVTLNLNGYSYSYPSAQSNVAPNPPNHGGDGIPGDPGQDGGAGGNFLGIGHHSRIRGTVHVSLNGGMGGVGQNGGSGGSGEDGLQLTLVEIKPADCDQDGIHKLPTPYGGYKPYPSQCDWWYLNTHCWAYYYGPPGKPGHRGGDGGAGGRSGKGGEFTFFSLGRGQQESKFSGIVPTSTDGSPGAGGKGGPGGQGGKRGDGIKLMWHGQTSATVLVDHKHWCTEVLNNWAHVPDNARAPAGESGKEGRIGGPPGPMKEDITTFGNNLINRFRRRARSILLSNRFLASVVSEFLSKMDQDVAVDEFTTPLALVQELSDLSEQMMAVQISNISSSSASSLSSSWSSSFKRKGSSNSQRLAFLPFLESFGRRVHRKAATRKWDEDSQKCLQIVYTAHLSLVVALRAGKDPFVVVLIESYFDGVERTLKELEKRVTNKRREEIIREEKGRYDKEIKAKLLEANNFINSVISPAVERIEREMEENIGELLEEIKEKRGEVQAEYVALEKKKAALQRAMKLHKIFGGFKIAAQVLRFLGPEGEAAAAAVGFGVGVVSHFVDKGDADKVIPQVVLPESITKAQEGVSASFTEYLNGKFGALNQTMKDIENQLNKGKDPATPLPDFKELKKKFSSVKNKLKKAWTKVTGPKEKGASALKTLTESESELKKAESEIQTAIEDEKAVVSSKTDVPETIRSKLLKRLGKAGSLADLATAGANLYNKYKDDAEAIQAVQEQMDAARGNMKQLNAQQDRIIETLKPMIQGMEKDMGQFQAGLGNKSAVALEVSKWVVTTTLRDLQTNIQSSFTQGMKVDQNMMGLFEKLSDALSTLINVYDRLQTYGDTAQLVNFITVVNKVGLEMRPIMDNQLREATESMDVILQAGLILGRYETAMRAFQLWVFPFAATFDFQLKPVTDFGKGLEAQAPALGEMALDAGQALRAVMDQRKDAEEKTGVYNTAIHRRLFYHDSPHPKSFFSWRNETHHSEIRALLRGDSVYLVSQVGTSPRNTDAIKFNKIRLDFIVTAAPAATGGETARNDAQKRLNTELAGFSVHMNHLGNSEYRFQGRFYTLTSPQVLIGFSMAERNGTLVDSNGNYNLLAKGDLVLSPYTTWEVQLVPLEGGSGNAEDFGELAGILAEGLSIDLELNGEGTYVDPDIPDLSSTLPIISVAVNNGTQSTTAPLAGMSNALNALNQTEAFQESMFPLFSDYDDQQRPGLFDNFLYMFD